MLGQWGDSSEGMHLNGIMTFTVQDGDTMPRSLI